MTNARVTSGRLLMWRWTLWFWFANAASLSLLAVRYFALAPFPESDAGALFRALILPAHFLLLMGAVLPVAIIPALLRPGIAARCWVIGVASACSMLVLVDIQVFSLYRFHLNGMVWSLLASGVADRILPFSTGALLQAGLVLGLVVLAETGLGFCIQRLVEARPRLWGRWVTTGALMILLSAQAMHAWADAVMYRPITMQARYLPWVRPMTAYSFFEKQGWLPPDAGRPSPLPLHQSHVRYPLAPLKCAASETPPNVLLIAIEEWRFDELDPMTSPNIWKFAERSLRFDNHWSTGSASRYGIFGLFYGLYGTYWDAMLAEQKGPVLIDEAIRQGYRFGVYGSAPLQHPEFDRTAFAALRERISLRRGGQGGSRGDRAITDAYLEFARTESASPFFAFLFFDSPHALDHPSDLDVPHSPALSELNHLDLGPDFDPIPLSNRHRNSVHYVDGLVREILEDLEARGLLAQTAVILTGDHGEEFNDTGQNYWGHNSNFSRYQVRVPLVLHLPDRTPQRTDRLTSHVDVAPTLLEEVFGCSTDAAVYSNGRNLFEESARPYVVANGRHLGVGLIQTGKVAVIEPLGGISIMDSELQPLEGEALPAPIARDFMNQASRFYRRE
jgi:membrane-anchored protein YejM (alkaline phosphatase superfamily)